MSSGLWLQAEWCDHLRVNTDAKEKVTHVKLRRNYKYKASLLYNKPPPFLSELSKVGTVETLQFSIFPWIFIFPKEVQTHLIQHLTFKQNNHKEQRKKID